MSSAVWKIYLLGGLRAERHAGGGGHAAPETVSRFRTQKTAALLAYLAFYKDRSHAREVLADLLWPDKALEEGRNSLSVALSSLRAQLEPPGIPPGSVIVADRFAVRLRPEAITTDVEEFERLLARGDRAGAVQAYGGELLPGFYEDWIIAEQERLAEACEKASRGLPPTAIVAPVEAAPKSALPIAPPSPKPPHATSTVHLPPIFTRFFGREAEIADLAALLSQPETRLVTLTGPGGTGKTRLAMETVRRTMPTIGETAWFVPLAEVSEASRIPDAVRAALGITARTSATPREQVASALKERPALLILDNLEQLAEVGGAEAVDELLHDSPALTVLVTSRCRLGLPFEREYPLAPLPAPPTHGNDVSTGKTHYLPEELARYESVRLFLDRAQAVRPDFTVTAHNAETIAEICRRLDGMPLAIELAASRVGVLAPNQLLAQLARRLDFLVWRGRGVTERHRTLRTAIDWSYRLLTPEAQRFFAMLSVFQGGWTYEDAAALWESHPAPDNEPDAFSGETRFRQGDALDLLETLRGASLVRVSEVEGVARFMMLETLREFARDHVLPDDWAALCAAHARRFLAIAEETEPLLTRAGQKEHLLRLEADHDNLRAALNRSLESDPNTAIRLAGGLARFWEMRGHLAEGQGWLERALNAAPIPPNEIDIGWEARAKALSGRGNLLYAQGRAEEAAGYYQEALEIRKRLGDPRPYAAALSNMGIIQHMMGDLATARQYHQESLTLKRQYGDSWDIATTLLNIGVVEQEEENHAAARARYEEALRLAREIGAQNIAAVILNNLGNMLCDTGDLAGGRRCHEESLAIKREQGDRRGTAGSLANLADIAFEMGDIAGTDALLREALEIYREIGSQTGIAICLEGFATLAAKAGDTRQAARLWGVADRLRTLHHCPLPPSQVVYQDARIAEARAVDPSAFEQAWQESRLLASETLLNEIRQKAIAAAA